MMVIGSCESGANEPTWLAAEPGGRCHVDFKLIGQLSWQLHDWQIKLRPTGVLFNWPSDFNPSLNVSLHLKQ